MTSHRFEDHTLTLTPDLALNPLPNLTPTLAHSLPACCTFTLR